MTGAGGLRLIGGGYGATEWLRREFDQAGEARVGYGSSPGAWRAAPSFSISR